MSRKSSSNLTQATCSKNSKKPLKTLKLARRGSNDGEPPTKKNRVAFTLSNPPVVDITEDDTVVVSSPQRSTSSRTAKSLSQSQQLDVEEKCKETWTSRVDNANSLWVDKYEPTSEAELAVHKRKVEDVRRWLLEAFDGGPSGKLRKYRRVLVLTGPAGTAKTSTLRVLSREMDFEILEWRNSMNERGPSAITSGDPPSDEELDFDKESLFDKFLSFLTRAMTCSSILRPHNITQSPPTPSLSLSQTHTATPRSRKRKLILLEDLPNLLHQPTRVRFQTALRTLCIPVSNLSEHPEPPIVIIVSDSGLRAEQPDDDAWSSASSVPRWDKKEALDIRNVLGPELLACPYVTRIGFNPIAPTLMTKALQALLTSQVAKQPPREVINIIVGSSNGDIRSAIMALQFACLVDLPANSKGKVVCKNVKKSTNIRAVLEAVTRREQSLVLFHLMGKILYNKRKYDAPASHLSVRDATKEHELDMQLIDPLPLPGWLSHHDRKASRVCTETLAAESPIDSSLLGLYIHQNYTQFCTDIDHCDGVCEGLSWIDCISGALSANSPYAFPALTLSTLHSLPTPVPRSGQKVCKPTWFGFHRKEQEALDAVGDVLDWLGKGGYYLTNAESSVSVGRWMYADVATELGGWLRALDGLSGYKPHEGQGPPYPQPPRTHVLFSYLPWRLGVVGDDVLGEEEGDIVEGGDGEDKDVGLPGGAREEGHGWLEDDDIEDVE